LSTGQQLLFVQRGSRARNRRHRGGRGPASLGWHECQRRHGDHARPPTGLELARVHGWLDAPDQTGEGSKESVGIILLAEARLDVGRYAAHLVHEVTVLRHQMAEAVPDLP